MPPLSPEQVRQLLSMSPLTDMEASALAAWYTPLTAAVATFPQADLRRVEPPLRSTPGPRA